MSAARRHVLRFALGGVLACAALLALAGVASSGGPPGGLGTVALKPLPKLGQSEFFVVTVTGTVAGKPKPPTMLLNGRIPAKMIAAAVEPPPVESGQKATARIYVAVFEPKKPVRAPAAASQGDALDFIIFGANQQWGAPHVSEKEIPCKEAKRELKHARFLWQQYWSWHSFAGLVASGLFKTAEKDAKDC